MPSGYKDSSPSAGASKGGGMENDDGREMGKDYSNKNKSEAAPAMKKTFDPNEDVSLLDGNRPGVE